MFHRQRERSWLKIDCGDLRTDTVATTPVDYETRDIAETGTQIDRRYGTAREEPAAKEMPDQPVATEVSIELLKVRQINPQLRRYELRAIHPFDCRLIEFPRRNQ